MLKLYSYWRSSASYRVRIALELKSIQYEYVPVHLVQNGGEQFSAVYRALNPQSRVPALEVDGKVITQSMAIVEWLEEQYPQPSLFPVEAFKKAQARSMAQLVACDIQPFQNLSTSRYLQEFLHVDEEQIKTWTCYWVDRGLAAFEELLVRRKEQTVFCNGDSPGIADIYLIPQCYAARRVGIDTSRYPTIDGIDKLSMNLPAFQRAAPDVQPDAM